MAKKEEQKTLLQKIGPWAFLVGLLAAVLATLFNQVWWVLGLIGVVVGLMNITDKETSSYLLASLTFLISATALQDTIVYLFENVPLLATMLKGVVPVVGLLKTNITFMVAPGAAVVALKALFNLSRD
ncbi:MAG: hypothetical protein HGA85_06275 [Nanoarchaeota archaeon]|nr:hypothetical protein [Nanoarchaeota archaeon]